MTKETLTDAFRRRTQEASADVDAINADERSSELHKLRAIQNIHDRYIAVTVREVTNALDDVTARLDRAGL